VNPHFRGLGVRRDGPSGRVMGACQISLSQLALFWYNSKINKRSQTLLDSPLLVIPASNGKRVKL
jgi:hypothetical protein